MRRHEHTPSAAKRRAREDARQLLLRNTTPHGVKIIGREHVENVTPDTAAKFIVQNALDTFDANKAESRRSDRAITKPYEVRIPEDSNIDTASLWLGKGVVDTLYRDAAFVNAGISCRFDRATEMAADRLQRYGSIEAFDFVLFAQPQNPDYEKAERIDVLRDVVAKLDRPALDIIVVEDSPNTLEHMSIQEMVTEFGIAIPPEEIFTTRS